MRGPCATVAVALVMGCNGAPPEEGCTPGESPSLSIGLGIDDYRPLRDGEDVPFVYGAQGGYHIELGLEASHLDAEEFVSGTFEGRVNGALIATAKPWLSFRCDPETDTQKSWGTLLIFDAQPADLHDRDAEIQAEVTDASGQTAQSTLTVHLIDPLVE